ncbi:GNAT family N-acetyltransferase [Thioalkalivibrio sp.]|uniref:GNAT family N-acetyltransferase n=1 Tax=Thioalkalivibrio sp. TaxID=2093813 RepID=UPI0039769420
MDAPEHSPQDPMNIPEHMPHPMDAPADPFRVWLRALEPEDAPVIYRWRNDPGYLSGVESIKRYISTETEKRWIHQAIRNHEEKRVVRLGIVLKATDELIGMVHLSNIDHVSRHANVGSLIGEPRHRGKGYVAEARFLLFEYGFMELGLQCISTRILASNTASIRSAERFGYVKEGVLRRRIYKEGSFQDLIAYSMLREEFMKKREAWRSRVAGPAREET